VIATLANLTLCITMILSTDWIVDSRWAMTRAVRPAIIFWMASRICDSVRLSGIKGGFGSCCMWAKGIRPLFQDALDGSRTGALQ
jgi:hypothetical protein